ncbi:MAG: phosphoglucosamine mutase [Clostridia bacterium]|nr:phosphoglucosamine mutase [Clostridia bacterium]
MGRLFGTDGVRGIANGTLTCELAMNIGRAAACVLTGNIEHRPKFIIGSDTRISSDMLISAICAGVTSVGADAVVLGVVPTPAVAYLVGKYNADAGIMISASHNPASFNGIKIFSSDGFKLPDALEEQIETLIIYNNLGSSVVTDEKIGTVTYSSTATEDYIDYLRTTISGKFGGLKIAVDCANGSASVTARKLFSGLSDNVTIFCDTPDGININKDCGSTHLEKLRDFVLENKCDIGIAFDGDADRCLCIDEKGNVVDGDFIMAICALDMRERGKLNKNTVVGTIMTNFGFTKFCEDQNIKFIPTKVGDRFVLEEMMLEDYSFGGEQSGHIIFRDYATTGDGQLTALQLLSILSRSGKKLSELASVMTRYPQSIVNITVSAEGKLKFYTDSHIKEAIETAKTILSKSGRIVVRPSGTEPLIRVMTEGMDKKLIEEIANSVAETIKKRLG